jgi:hypothetical protein
MEYSSIKKDEIMLFAGKCMELEIIMLSEVSRPRKTNITCFCSYAESRPTKTYKKEGEKVEWLRKNNIDGVNLIKAHYMHVVNITKKLLCIINLC